jgi:hypothetical protein
VYSAFRKSLCTYKRILGLVYENEKENWRILTNKEIYAVVKKPTITKTIRLHRLCWFGHGQRMEGNRIPKRVLCMNWNQQEQELDKEINGKIKSLSGSAAQHGLWPPRSRVSLITHNEVPQSVGLLWTSDQLVTKTST